MILPLNSLTQIVILQEDFIVSYVYVLKNLKNIDFKERCKIPLISLVINYSLKQFNTGDRESNKV